MAGASAGEGRLLVVNADDFGVTAGVSRGILESHRRGIVSSTTAMVNLAPQSDLEAEALGLPGLGVGLHFNLTWGGPVSPRDLVPSLVDGEGRFRRDPVAVARRAAPDEVRREAEAQIEAFARRFGRSPTHLDSHHHVHRRPGVLDAVADVAASAGLALRSPDAGFRDGLRRRGLRTADHFVGGDDPAPYWTLPRLLDTLAGLPTGVTELMCHPGYFDADLAYSRYGPPRETELAALTDPEARATLDRLDIRLCHFGTLPTA
jgi:predicted glycoside hydrolase/deacetylase ChbG (UPF0249 family)